MSLKQNISIAFAVFLMVIFWSQCASPGMPQGGPRDVEPPLPLIEAPLNQSTNFSGDRIIIHFDEFIELKDPNSEILISPPLKEKPDYRIRGKSLVVKFNDTLLPNTTYNIFFGESIVDLTENNPLTAYRYVFSTGNRIDSLSIRGNVNKAFNLEPEEDVFVMLYLDNNDTLPFDSLPYHVRPEYLAKTGEDGSFALENLRDLKYKIFAIRDINSNLIYDLPNEEIAFLDSMLIPEYIPVPDTLTQDSLLPDSLEMDTVIRTREIADLIVEDTMDVDTDSMHVNIYNLFMFQEIDSTQKFISAELENNRLLNVIYAFPGKNTGVEVINHNMDTIDWTILEKNPTMDTLKYWINDMPFDTLMLKIIDDTLVFDTVRIVFKAEKTKKGKEKSKDKEKNKDKKKKDDKPTIRSKSNARGGSLDLHRPLRYVFDFPVVQYDFSNWLLIENNEDTLEITPEFADPVKRKLLIWHPWKESTEYKLFFPDSVLFDLTGASNDTVNLEFTTRSLSDYGIISMDFVPDPDCSRYIIQLLSEDEKKKFHEQIVTEPETLVYEYLKPGKYMIKAICDSNGNGKWDTGKYMDKLQPEKVMYFHKVIDLRANWEIEEAWDLSH